MGSDRSTKQPNTNNLKNMSNKKSIQYGVIESGHPVPERKQGGGRPPKYPWDKMKVGDRMAVESNGGSANANSYAKNNGLKAKFVLRTIDGVHYVYRVS